MNCFPCFSSKTEEDEKQQEDAPAAAADENNSDPAAQPSFTPPAPQQASSTDNRPSSSDEDDHDDNDEPFDADEDVNSAKAFTFRELASAAKNFRQECLIGEGGYGRVFRGTLQCSGQIVAVRKLDRSGTQGSKEFEVDVLMLSLLHHQNLVRLIGYCAEGDQRLLVYEYMPTGSLTKHLFDIPADKKPLNWSARMRIASGIAQGLEYLHEKANPPIIYRDLKSTNILLDETNNPRLSEYGLAKLVQQNGNKMHLAPKTATSGYCAPEYERNGDLTLKSDVYSFGVVLLVLISGRKALDPTRPAEEENLVTWAQPIFRDPKRFPDLADPLLKGEFSITSLNQVVGVAAMCLQEEPMVRPMISDIVAALSFLAMAPPNAPIPARLAPILSTRVETLSKPANVPGLKNGKVVSKHKKDKSSDSEGEDENDQELPSNDDNSEDGSNDDNKEEGSDDDNHEEGHSQNSNHDCTDTSESDSEDNKVVPDVDQKKSSEKIKESAKWSSSSIRRSKAKSKIRRSITGSSKNGSTGSSEPDTENKKVVTVPDQNKSSKKFKESAKWSSSSKRRSRAKTEGGPSITISSGNGSTDSSEPDTENKKDVTDPDQNKSSKKFKESAKWSPSSKQSSKAKSEGGPSITSSSGNGSTDSSEPDTENKKVVTEPYQNKSSKKFKESAKWSSSSKRSSKPKSEGGPSITSSSGNGSTDSLEPDTDNKKVVTDPDVTDPDQNKSSKKFKESTKWSSSSKRRSKPKSERGPSIRISSGNGNTDSSESDTEDKKVVMNLDQNKSSKKFKESAKWSSSSKRRSKGKSEGTGSSGNGSSFGSSDSSVGFSLRCDSAYPERSLHSDSRQDYNSRSSSEEESVSGSSNRRLNKDVNASKRSNKSKRQYSSSGSHSRKYENVEQESDDESDFVYSRHSSSAGSDYGEHSPKHDEED